MKSSLDLIVIGAGEAGATTAGQCKSGDGAPLAADSLANTFFCALASIHAII